MGEAPAPESTSNRDRLGLCQWFHFQDHAEVERAIALMQELGVRHLRTGISWADFHRPGGHAWYDWQLRTLADAGLELLVSVWHTPPSLAEGHACAGPPCRLQDYADFIDLIINQWGDCFQSLELWNEPNNKYKWAFHVHDPCWAKFGEMIGMAGHWANQLGKPTVLGGMIPVDPDWLALMRDYGTLDQVDVVAIHGFPGMWWSHAPNWDWYHHWHGWAEKVQKLTPITQTHPIWITETGLATWDLTHQQPAHHALQVRMLEQAVAAPVPRLYWYSLIDLHPQRSAIEGFHVDENEYHLGLVTYDGQRKPAFDRFAELLEKPAPDDATPSVSSA